MEKESETIPSKNKRTITTNQRTGSKWRGRKLLTLTMTVMSRRGVRGYHTGSGLFLLRVTAHGGMFSLPSASLRLGTRTGPAAVTADAPLRIKKPPPISPAAVPPTRTARFLASGISTFESHSRTKRSPRKHKKWQNYPSKRSKKIPFLTGTCFGLFFSDLFGFRFFLVSGEEEGYRTRDPHGGVYRRPRGG